MTTIHLPEDLEAILADRAARNGTSVERLAIDALRGQFLHAERTTEAPAAGTLAELFGPFVGSVHGTQSPDPARAFSIHGGELFADEMQRKRDADEL